MREGVREEGKHDLRQKFYCKSASYKGAIKIPFSNLG
jgi:hypothetical protein